MTTLAASNNTCRNVKGTSVKGVKGTREKTDKSHSNKRRTSQVETVLVLVN